MSFLHKIAFFPVALLSITSAGAQTVAPQQGSYVFGENIKVDYSGGPGNNADWIAIYDPGVTPDGDPEAHLWLYLNGTQSPGISSEGETVLDSVTGRGNAGSVPEIYGSNAANTPNISLDWGDDNYQADGWDGYLDWNGRGEVIQADFGQSNPVSVDFIPSSASIGALITSFDLDEWAGGGNSVITWSIKNGASTIVSGTWNDFSNAQGGNGGRSTVNTGMTVAQAQANAGGTLTLELTLVSGASDYQAIDNLTFSQVLIAGTVLDSVTGLANNQGVPEAYGSNEPATPEISLDWGSGLQTDGWDSYGTWDGRSQPIQTDYTQSGTLSVNFIPANANVGVHVISFELDEFTGGGDSEVTWAIKNGATIIVSGTWNDFNNANGGNGGRSTVYTGMSAAQAVTNLGDTLTLELTLVSGSGDYQAMDNLIFAQVVNPQQAGTVTFSNPTLPVGDYKVWFLANDGYTVIAGPSDLGVTGNSPTWVTSAFRRRHAVVSTAYTGLVSAYAYDTDGDTLTYSKVSGPAWLAVASNGTLSGTPGTGDVGNNTFVLRASDGTYTADTTMNVEVFAVDTEIVSELKVMSYNAWHGWGQMNNGHRKGLESIILSGADIIGMQESSDNVSGSGVYQPQKIAADLGWYYRSNLSSSLGLISRYPITDQTLTSGIARGIKVRLTTSPSQEVILMNCHLDYTDYGPYAAQLPGATVATVLTEENSSDRDEQIAAIMSAMSTMLSNADNIPVLLTGDFNAPSHLDWTAATAGSHNGVGSVPWPTSTAVINAGMFDSFRAVHPDPTALPGDTWSPVFKGTEPQDRIDFVYYKGASLQPIASQVFTTAVESTTGAWGSSITPLRNNTWPSDHASVLTTFRIKPVDADNDELSDAFEMKYFGSLTAEDGTGDYDDDGSSDRLEQSLGTSPVDFADTPVQVIAIPSSPLGAASLNFQLSPLAFDYGLVCERSHNLGGWTTVWSFKDDPELQSSLIEAALESTGSWMVVLTDPAANLDAGEKVFYRLRIGE